MTSNSSNRIYLGTINPGGSLSQSGGPVRARPYTTPAAPGRSSFGSTNNALTVLSSHPTTLRNDVSPHEEDLVMIEEEVSSASMTNSSRTSSFQSSVSSESVSSVSVHSPVRQVPSQSIPQVNAVQQKEVSNTESLPAAQKDPLKEKEKPSVSSSEAPPKKTRPVIESSKLKKPTISTVDRVDKTATKPGKSTSSTLAKEKKNTDTKGKDQPSSTSKTKSSSTASSGVSKLVSSTHAAVAENRKRPETAGATSKPKCVSLGRKELIGKGSFGMVYKALDLDTNRLLAVKEIPLEGPGIQQLPTVRREILLMEKLNHPNIVQCFGHDIDDQYLRIYMEFVAGGCVSSLLKNFGSFQERQASIVTKQVLSGLQYLHDRKIAHRDLKGDNILLQPDGTVKLADFGTARELATTAMSLAGTAYFMAPEMIKGTGHGLEADIWSVGCCIIEMLTGKPPFSHLVNQYAIMTHIAESEGPFDDAFPKNASPAVIHILKQCLVKDPSKRATCKQLLEEEWIKNPPLNADMKGPLVLELNTVSEVRERLGKKSDTAKANSTADSSRNPQSIRGVSDTNRSSMPLSSFNPMVDDD